MFYLTTTLYGEKFYVSNSVPKPTPDLFGLTTDRSQARKFKGGGTLSGTTFGAKFTKEPVEPQYVVTSYKTPLTNPAPKQEALEALRKLAASGTPCLSLKEVE